MATRRERIIELGSLIAAERERIQSARERLRACETELDRLLAGAAGESEQDAGRDTASSVQPAGATLAQRCADVIDGAPGTRFTAEQIASATGAKIDTIRSTLARLADAKRIAKPERGIYQSLRQPDLPVPQESKEDPM